MNFRFTLLFLCDQSHCYSSLISAFVAADVQLLIARNVEQAEALLLRKSVHGILIRHDRNRDDRRFANHLKRTAPRVPIFLLTDQEQPRDPDIESIWRADIGDETITRAMALFFSQVFKPSGLFGARAPIFGEADFLFRGITPQGSG